MSKTFIPNKNVLNIYMITIFYIKYMLYKNAHDRTIFIFLNVIIFQKLGCANLDANFAASPVPEIRLLDE